MDCYAFDCDGTISLSGGQVAEDRLRQLKGAGDVVAIVSPSGACQRLWKEYEYFQANQGDVRTETLRMVKKSHPGCGRYVYVSDNPGDDVRAADAGFEYVHPIEFTKPDRAS